MMPQSISSFGGSGFALPSQATGAGGGTGATGLSGLSGLSGLGGAGGLGSSNLLGSQAGAGGSQNSLTGSLMPETAQSLNSMGVSNSTLMLMGQIATMMASVMSGIMQMMQQLSQQQQSGGGAGTGGLGGVGGGFGGGGYGGTGGVDGGSGGSGGGTGGVDGGSGSGGTGGTSGTGGGDSGKPAPGNVGQSIDQAVEILKASGIPADKMNKEDIAKIIQHESGGNPQAINKTDSNAKKGTPSKGLMQCIDPTFNSYKLPGHDDIYNPVDNIIAGVRYAVKRYGSVSNVPGIASMKSGGGYKGY